MAPHKWSVEFPIVDGRATRAALPALEPIVPSTGPATALLLQRFEMRNGQAQIINVCVLLSYAILRAYVWISSLASERSPSHRPRQTSEIPVANALQSYLQVSSAQSYLA